MIDYLIEKLIEQSNVNGGIIDSVIGVARDASTNGGTTPPNAMLEAQTHEGSPERQALVDKLDARLHSALRNNPSTYPTTAAEYKKLIENLVLTSLLDDNFYIAALGIYNSMMEAAHGRATNGLGVTDGVDYG